MTTPADGAAALRTVKVLSGALMFALVVIGIAIFAVTRSGPKASGSTPPWVWIVAVGLGAVMAVLIPAVGYPVATDAGGADDAMATRMRYQQGMLLRFALAESVAIVGIALTFSDRRGNFLIYLLAAVISLALMSVHVWPSARLMQRAQDKLNRNGASYDVLGAYGLR